MPFVNAPASTANENLELDGLHLNDGTVFLLDTLDCPPPPRLIEWVRSADSDGSLLAREPPSDNREVTARIIIQPQASMDLALAKIALIVDRLEEAKRNPLGINLVWQSADATLQGTFKVLYGEVTELPITREAGWVSKSPTITVRMVCGPFMEGVEVASYVNLVTNPSFEVDTAGWLASGNAVTAGSTLSRVTSQFQVGAASAKVIAPGGSDTGICYRVAPASVPVSTAVSMAVWLRGEVGGEVIQAFMFDAASSIVGPITTATLTTSWQRFVMTGTTPATVAAFDLVLRNTTATARTFYVDAVQFGLGTVPAYFDGASGAGYAWTGTAHASTSVGPNAVVSALPVATLELTGIPGDVTARG